MPYAWMFSLVGVVVRLDTNPRGRGGNKGLCYGYRGKKSHTVANIECESAHSRLLRAVLLYRAAYHPPFWCANEGPPLQT